MSLSTQTLIIAILCYWSWSDAVNYFIKHQIKSWRTARMLTYLGLAILVLYVVIRLAVL